MNKKVGVNKKQDEVEARVALLEYQFGEVRKGLDRIESKQDAAIRQIDTLKYVSQHEFDEYRKESEKKFAAKDALGSMTRLLYWLLGIVGSIFLLGIAAFIGLVLK